MTSNPSLNLKHFIFIALAVFLLVPGCARAPRRVSPPLASTPVLSSLPGFYHTVQRGRTIYRIAKNYRLDWHELMAVNHVSNPSKLEVGQKIFIPQPAAPLYPPTVSGPLSMEKVQRIVGPKNYTSDWRTITLHHSGTLKGGAKVFDRDHQRRHMGGLFYHFVIGNGTNTQDGALEVGWRWKRQVKANRPYDIQICVVGDFNRQHTSEAQFSTLLRLIQVLRQDYGVSTESIRRHEDIKGKHTECPGRNFPFDRILNKVRNEKAVGSYR
jgi:LysM repeat protein